MEGNIDNLVNSLRIIRTSLSKYDALANAVGEEGDLAVKHQEFKECISWLIKAGSTDTWKESLDNSIISEVRREQLAQDQVKENIMSDFMGFYTFFYTALTTADKGMEARHAIHKVDFNDPDIMDRIMRIHGNKLPPQSQSLKLYLDPLPIVYGTH